MLTTRILRSVEGLSNRFNDIIYKPPKDVILMRDIVCYFGGDVQDFRSNMVENSNNKNCVQFLDYCLENMANILSNRFTSSDICVIRANRFHDKTYAVYDNLVVSDRFGCPKHEFTKDSLIHLRLLLINCFNQLNIELDFKNVEKLVLIGFSKGCVVLNQFLYAFYVSSEDILLKELIKRIDRMYWCDGGHSGGANTWITSQEVLKHFAKFNIKVHINVSPYQVLCPSRPWIAKEEKIFSDTLTQFGVNTQRVLHFADEEPSLEMHFKVIKHFV